MTGKRTTSSADRLKLVHGGGIPRPTPDRVSEKPSLFPCHYFEEDEPILDVGETRDCCWIIITGEVALSVPDPETGELRECVKLGAGHVFGADLNEASAPSIFQITAKQQCKVYTINPEDLTSQGGDAALIRSRVDYLRRARDATFPKLMRALKELAEMEARALRQASEQAEALALVDQQREEAERHGIELNDQLIEHVAMLSNAEQERARLLQRIADLQEDNRLLARDNVSLELVERCQALHQTKQELTALQKRVTDLQANAESAMNYVTDLMEELVNAQNLNFDSLNGEDGEVVLGLLSNLFQRMLESDNPRTRKFALDALGGLSRLPALVAKRQLKT